MNRSIALQKSDVGVLLVLQLALVALAGGGFLFAQGAEAAQATAYGGGIAALNTWLLGRRVLRASEVAKTHPGQETMVLYVGVIQRFVVVLMLFGLGMGWLGLQPVPLLIGFAVAQLGYFVNGTLIRARAGTHVGRVG